MSHSAESAGGEPMDRPAELAGGGPLGRPTEFAGGGPMGHHAGFGGGAPMSRSAEYAGGAPTRLRVEHWECALGIRTAAPRLSWHLPGGAREQRAYRITTDNGWDSGWVSSGEHLLVRYAGPPPGSSQRVEWRVRVRTDRGESAPSAPAWFETGLLTAEDWTAAWIEPGTMPGGEHGHRPAALLRVEFDVDRPVVAARLHATAHGLYEAFLNGDRVGDAELTPGYTQYDVRLQVQTYDVTPSIHEGCNALGVILADGWFRGQVGITRAAAQWGDRLALLAQLHLTHADGRTTILGTGPAWHSTFGHVTEADLIEGETWDLRRLRRDWTRPTAPAARVAPVIAASTAPGHEPGKAASGADAGEAAPGVEGGWDAVAVVEHGYAGLVDSPAPPVRRVEEIAPVSVTRLGERTHLVDLGQNINGWVRLTNLGPAGTELTLTHGEWLGSDGDLTTDHLRPAVPFLPHPLPAGQVDRVTSAGVESDTFEPRRTTHGFRYVRVDGHPNLRENDVRGVVVHTDLRRTGWFTSSDERLNRLHEAARWSFRDNACDIPTDCPHRERHGWTGDWQLFVPTAAFLYDVAGFSTKWLRDVAADQWPDGTIANVSPSPRHEGRDGPIAMLNGSAGWGDAAVIVPWEIYRAYGDEQLLEELWPTMCRWLDRAERTAREHRHPQRAAARPEPAPHERYLWDTGFHWGEWLVPGEEIGDFGAFITADKGEVATAYLAHSAGLMARIAALIGRDPRHYADLAANARAAWQAEYLDAEGTLIPDTQADHVRALAFALVPDDRREHTAARLVALIRKAGTHLGTGFLATPYLLPVLADAGHLDVAYDLLFSDSEPSWLVMVDRGATTVWEHWDGVDADGVPRDSLNHYSKGAVISFLHRYVAGLSPIEPAYRRFRVRPRPGGGLTHASAAHESPYGRIEVAWRRGGDLRVVVPAGTEADVVLPGRVFTVGPGAHTFDMEGFA